MDSGQKLDRFWPSASEFFPMMVPPKRSSVRCPNPTSKLPGSGEDIVSSLRNKHWLHALDSSIVGLMAPANSTWNKWFNLFTRCPLHAIELTFKTSINKSSKSSRIHPFRLFLRCPRQEYSSNVPIHEAVLHVSSQKANNPKLEIQTQNPQNTPAAALPEARFPIFAIPCWVQLEITSPLHLYPLTERQFLG